MASMPDDQIAINPKSSDFYRPTDRLKRGGLSGFVVKISGGRVTEKGANYFLLGFAIIVFIISIIILVTTL